MTDIFKKNLLPEIDVFNKKMRINICKDLFTKKLGDTIYLNFDKNQKNNKFLRHPEFSKNVKTFPKNKRISFFSLNKEENLRKIWEPKMKFNFYNLDELTEKENKKMLNLHVNFSLKNDETKKVIKNLFNNKEEKEKHRKIIVDSFRDYKNYNSYIDNDLRKNKIMHTFE